MVLILRNQNHASAGPKSFAEDHHPLFRPAEIQLRALDGALILAFLAGFVGLVFLLSK